jgi:RecG-like helicase
MRSSDTESIDAFVVPTKTLAAEKTRSLSAMAPPVGVSVTFAAAAAPARKKERQSATRAMNF